jgi:hypothetical protein
MHVPAIMEKIARLMVIATPMNASHEAERHSCLSHVGDGVMKITLAPQVVG